MINTYKEILKKEFEVICDGTRKGRICGYTEKFEDGWKHYYILVKFHDNGEIKPFYFPDSFRVHLKAVDSQIQKTILNPTTPVDPPPVSPPPPRRLVFGANVGTDSQKCYVKLCDLFGWDESKKRYFGWQSSLMYAQNCTPEGYSVWFVPHNNLIEPFSENYSWFNIRQGNFIKEVWLKGENSSLRYDWSDRITFLKTKDGYVFYGIYRPQKPIQEEILYGKERTVKIYEQISTEYSNH